MGTIQIHTFIKWVQYKNLGGIKDKEGFIREVVSDASKVSYVSHKFSKFYIF